MTVGLSRYLKLFTKVAQMNGFREYVNYLTCEITRESRASTWYFTTSRLHSQDGDDEYA